MLMGDEMYMADNSKASVNEGNEYTISMANGSADVTSVIITWTEVNGNGIRTNDGLQHFRSHYGWKQY